MPKDKLQSIEKAKGRAMLTWAGKKPLESIEYYPAQEKEVYGDKKSPDFNKLFWGDNLQVLAHLLKEYRGKIDLIYIDPPFDSKADYVREIQFKGEKMSGEGQGLFEEKQYGDIWGKDEYLQFMYERLLVMKELLNENTGVIVLHCDDNKEHYLRLLLDEVFGPEAFLNYISYRTDVSRGAKAQRKWFGNNLNLLFCYARNKTGAQTSFHPVKKIVEVPTSDLSLYKKDKMGYFSTSDKGTSSDASLIRLKQEGRLYITKGGELLNEDGEKITATEGTIRVKYYLTEKNGRFYKETYVDNIWDDLLGLANKRSEDTGYPTQKIENLLERIILCSTKEGDLVADFFMGSGTTQAVAQKLGRKWIGCDINLGAIQTATKRLNQIIEEQKGARGFKVLNVNDYTAFKNELEAKEIVMEMYGVETIKRSYFDGVLDTSYVKVMPMNRVLNKLDIKTLLKNVNDKIADFTVKRKSKSGEAVYDEGVLVICSGMDLEVVDYLKKENKTGVKIDVRDITTDKKNLVFKLPPEAHIEVKVKDKKLSVSLKEFYSPILMRKLEIENGKTLKKEYQAKVEDFKQIIDSVAIDVNYSGNLFNAEIMDLPSKRELIKADYSWKYAKKGKYTVAVKIVDVLGEEYFETFKITA